MSFSQKNKKQFYFIYNSINNYNIILINQFRNLSSNDMIIILKQIFKNICLIFIILYFIKS